MEILGFILIIVILYSIVIYIAENIISAIENTLSTKKTNEKEIIIKNPLEHKQEIKAQIKNPPKQKQENRTQTKNSPEPKREINTHIKSSTIKNQNNSHAQTPTKPKTVFLNKNDFTILLNARSVQILDVEVTNKAEILKITYKRQLSTIDKQSTNWLAGSEPHLV